MVTELVGIINPLKVIDELIITLDCKLGHFPTHEENEEEYGLSLKEEVYDKFINERYPWTQGKVPCGYWNKRNKNRAVKWIYEKANKEKKKITKNYFIKNKLGGLIRNHYNGSPLKALQEAYPKNRLIQETPWLIKEISQVPLKYWQEKAKRIKAIKWVYEKAKKEKKEIKYSFLEKNGLGGLIYNHYNNSSLKALKEAYPDDPIIQETPWLIKELKRVPNDYWIEENKIKAIKWVYEKAKKEKKEITIKYLKKNSLIGLITFYNGSPLQALQAAYPDDPIIQETPWLIKEITQIHKGYWEEKENRIKAIKWVYEKAKKEKKKITGEYLAEKGLGGLIRTKYDGSPLKALQEAYPDDQVIQETPWLIKEISKVPKNYWNEEILIRAIKTIYDDLKEGQELIKPRFEEKSLNCVYSWWNHNKGGIQGLIDFYNNYFINKAKELSKGRNVESTIESKGVKGNYEKADIKLVMLALVNNYLPETENKNNDNNGNSKKKEHENKEIVKIEYQ
jgi:hypothetical protein